MAFGFAGLKGPYAVFIILLMVLGIVATAFYFYNATTQNPCGDPGPAKFAAIPDQTLDVNGQPKTYSAVAANFTGTQQVEVISSYAFYTTAFNDPSLQHLINGSCGSDPYTPASITIRVTSSSSGQPEVLTIPQFKGSTSNPTQVFISGYHAGLLWNPRSTGTVSLVLLVAKS